jgi:ribulose-5-phosphate 4-epimerase/fuculose-1-phosphate aldolase
MSKRLSDSIDVLPSGGFTGIADNDAQGQRLAASFGNRHVMMMGNHGITVAASSIAQTFDDLYFFERAAKTLMLAYSSGRPLAILGDAAAEKTAAGWEACQGMAVAHFEQLKAMLLAEDASFASWQYGCTIASGFNTRRFNFKGAQI